MELLPLLTQLGLEPKQAVVYLSCLELGQASMSEIAKHARLKRPTTYLAVAHLELLGLLSRTPKGKRLEYAPVHPRRLQEIAKLREQRISDGLPELTALYNTPHNKPKIQVFEGIEGMRLLYRDLYRSLSEKEEALFFSRISTLRTLIPEALSEFKKIIRELHNPKVRELNYDDAAAREWAKETRHFQNKFYQVRLLPSSIEFGHTDNLIFGNKLVTFSLKQEVFVIVIESEDTATTYRALFELAWKQGVPWGETKR